MKIVFYDTKPYDKPWFERLSPEYGHEIRWLDCRLNAETAVLADGFEAVCVFVNDIADKNAIDELAKRGVKLIALRSAGYNNVDVKAAEGRLRITRVPEYSPAAVAEHAAALLLSVNRKTHRAYTRTRENNFNINGLIGFDLSGKTAGIIGTGKIGGVFAQICKGFNMEVVAYDVKPRENADYTYLPLDELFARADIISLHCPLTPETRHLLNAEAFAKMKEHAIVINTSRGGLINTRALITALKSKKLGGAGLDVYEEEGDYFFQDFSAEIIGDDDLARLLSFPNVVLTSHQGFFTEEAMEAIARVTLENVRAFEKGETLVNEIKA